MNYSPTAGTVATVSAREYFRSLDDCLPDLRFQLPKCDSDVTLRKTLAEVAQTFCRETGCFLDTATITLVDGTLRYAIPMEYPTLLHAVKSVKLLTYTNGTLTTKQTLDPAHGYDIEDFDDEDSAYIVLPYNRKPPANVTYTLEVLIKLIPKLDQVIGSQAYGFPDKLIQRWRSAFVDGCIARLASMDGRGWTNKTQAAEAAERYRKLEVEARGRSNLDSAKHGADTNIMQPEGWV